MSLRFSEYLSSWLLSAPITKDISPERLFDLTRYPLEQVHRALQSFWHSYTRQIGWDAALAEARLLKAVRFTGARMIHTTFEQLQTAIRLSSQAVYLLQLSYNVLERPRQASADLLGMPAQPK